MRNMYTHAKYRVTIIITSDLHVHVSGLAKVHVYVWAWGPGCTWTLIKPDAGSIPTCTYVLILLIF